MDIFETKVVDLEHVTFRNPVVIGGFVGTTLTGFIAASYIIERLGLHQIAHVKSSHIPPISVFIGKKLRTPFRIYSNSTGTLIVAICEVPVDDEGLYEISSALIDWISSKEASELVILEGSPVKQVIADHKVYCIANEGKLKEFTDIGIEAARSALIMGMGGALINDSMARKISGVSFITPTTLELPDPGSVLGLIETVNKAYGLNIDTKVLEESVKTFHAQLQELMDQYKQAQGGKDKAHSESMYG